MMQVQYPDGSIEWAHKKYIIEHVQCVRCGEILVRTHDQQTGEISIPVKSIALVAARELVHGVAPHDCGLPLPAEHDPRRN
jgi:hypothetical protein